MLLKPKSKIWFNHILARVKRECPFPFDMERTQGCQYHSVRFWPRVQGPMALRGHRRVDFSGYIGRKYIWNTYRTLDRYYVHIVVYWFGKRYSWSSPVTSGIIQKLYRKEVARTLRYYAEIDKEYNRGGSND